jgi:16S rRNA (adenine1518-N6/adenine1519-N6)-dimethyltransferase
MDLLEETKQLCALYHIKPTRSRGQNFLITPQVYDEIIESSGLRPADKVLEVGSGLGFLTIRLAEIVEEVVAVELDRGLAEVLRTRLEMKEVKNVHVIQNNILDFTTFKNLPKGFTDNYKIVANLPYNITSIFLRKFLEGNFKPTSLTLMLQKEVAERIVADKGDMSLLALSVQFFAKARIIAPVTKHDFWPAPAVDSAIIHLQVIDKYQSVDQKQFFRLAKIGFSSKRKMLKNNLANGLKISTIETQNMIIKAGLNPLIRAEDLGLDDWVKLLGLAKQFML